VSTRTYSVHNFSSKTGHLFSILATTERMTFRNPHVRLLLTLAKLSQADETIDLMSLSEAARLSPLSALRALVALETKGWVDARKLRLTLAGLAIAQAIVGQKAGVRTMNAQSKAGAADACADLFNARGDTGSARRKSFAA
jgi:glycine/D-amino acid oxidase-like deaminating enzyme